MLKRIIATAMSFALASASMIASVNDFSYAETTEVSEVEYVFALEETTEISEVENTSALEETTTSSAAEVGRNIRKSLNLTSTDIIYFDDMFELSDKDANAMIADMGSRIFIIGIDDENQRFRVYAPKVNGYKVTYLTYEDAKEADVVSHDGICVGDLDYDKRVDVFDLCLLRAGLIYGWDDPREKMLADVNSDDETNVADIVWLQSWLLGRIK